MFEYIRNGLPKITLGEIILWGGAVIGFFKAIETIFGKKYLGSWAWSGLKRVFMMPVTIMHKLEELRIEVKFIRDEVQYNGGTIKLRDAVEKIDKNVGQALAQAKDNGSKITELDTRFDISEECDSTMIFKMNATGGCDYCNQSFYKYFGFAEQDIIDFNWENIIKPTELQEVRKKWERAYATKSQYFNVQTIKKKSGEEIICRVMGLPKIIDNTLKGFYGTVTLQ